MQNDPFYTSGFQPYRGLGSPIEQAGLYPEQMGQMDIQAPQMQPNTAGVPMPNAMAPPPPNTRPASVRGGLPFNQANQLMQQPPAQIEEKSLFENLKPDIGSFGRPGRTREEDEGSSMFSNPFANMSNAGAMGLLSAGAAMLQASGPRPEGSTNLAQILGQGLQAGMQGYGQAKQREQQKQQFDALEAHRKNTLQFQKDQLASQDAVRKEQIKGIQTQNKQQALQLKYYEDYGNSIDKSVKSGYITSKQAEFLKGLDPANGMRALVTFAGQSGKKVTGIKSEKIPGTNHTALFRTKEDGSQEYVTTVANKEQKGIKKGDIQLGGTLNNNFGVTAYDDGRYYQKDKDGNWKAVDPNSFKDAMALRKESDKSMNPYRDLARQYSTIEENTANDSAAGDLAIVFSFMKMLDPGSVVRESEFGQVVASQGYFDQAVQWYKKNFQKGDAGERLPQELRNQILSVSKGIKDKFSKEANEKALMYQDLASQRRSIDFQNFKVVNPFDEIAPKQNPANTSNTTGFLYPEQGEFADRFAIRLGYPSWNAYQQQTGDPNPGPQFGTQYPTAIPNLRQELGGQNGGSGQTFNSMFRR